MRKIFIIIVIFSIWFTSCEKNYIADIAYFDISTCVIVPLSENDLKINYRNVKINQKDYRQIMQCIEEKQIVTTVNQIVEFNLDFLDESIDIKKSNKEPKYEEIPIDDYVLNVRMVCTFNNKQVSKIVLGRNPEYIKLNDNYYKISNSDYEKLIMIFTKYIGKK